MFEKFQVILLYLVKTKNNIRIGVKMADGQQVPTKIVPTGVKIISVLSYIGAVILFISGIALLIGAGFVGSLLAAIPLIETLGAGLFVAGGIIMIGFGVLFFFIGRGLWKGRRWARIVVIVFAFLGVLMSIISMIMGGILTGIPSIIIDLAIGLYLLLNSSVKKAFV